jgi:flavodoxin
VTYGTCIVYHSETGNTEKMAKAVAEGARSVIGMDVELNYYMSIEELAGYDAIVVALPHIIMTCQ